MLLVRVLPLLTFAANPTSAPRVNLLAIVISSLVILMYEASVGNVYKKWYLTLLENSFVFNLGILAVGTLFINLGGGNQAALVYTSVGVAFSQFVGIATFYAYTSLKQLRIFKVLREKLVPDSKIWNTKWTWGCWVWTAWSEQTRTRPKGATKISSDSLWWATWTCAGICRLKEMCLCKCTCAPAI